MMELKTKGIFFLILKLLVLMLLITAIIVTGVISNTSAKMYGGGAVVTNGLECAKMGASILKKGGSVADAAVTTIICEGITCPQSTGVSCICCQKIRVINKILIFIRTRRWISFNNLH